MTVEAESTAAGAIMSRIRIGVSGWAYPHWRKGAFYPGDLPQRRELEYLSRRLCTVELNRSFYSLLRPETYAAFREQVPRGFVFAVKGGQFITHSKKLRDVEVPLANFLASGVLALEDTLGPMLWQLPKMRLPAERVEAFLDLLPPDTAAASRLARRHDDRVKGRSATSIHRTRALRHALEIRHPESLSDSVVRACRAHNVALVFSHSGGEWPYREEITAGWCYLRLHGAPRTYASNYEPDALEHWHRRIVAWADGREPPDAVRVTSRTPPARKGRDIYVYFDNDQGAHAAHNGLALKALFDHG